MPDNQIEPTAACRGCGNLVVLRLADRHRDVCPGKIANTFRQYREQHGGEHIVIGETHTSFDTDIDAILTRLDLLEARPIGQDGSAGVNVTDWIDLDPEQLQPTDPGTPRHPATDEPTGINPMTGLPYPA